MVFSLQQLRLVNCCFRLIDEVYFFTIVYIFFTFVNSSWYFLSLSDKVFIRFGYFLFTDKPGPSCFALFSRDLKL